MDGLLLLLLDDTRSLAGRWFWPCFEPLRAEFDAHYWIVLNTPWFGAPTDFDGDKETVAFEGMAHTSVTLWRPGSIGRWAARFSEESICLWAVDPELEPSEAASGYDRAMFGREDDFIEQYGVVWLNYLDTFCWEIFSGQTGWLSAVREHATSNSRLRVFETSSQRPDNARSLAVAELINSSKR